MSHISSLFSYLEMCNNTICELANEMPEPVESTILEAFEVAAADIATRTIAVAMAAIACITSAFYVIPQLIMLNARLSIGPSALICILKANWAFLKTLVIGILSPIGAIFFPKKIYGEWKMQEQLQTQIAEVLAQIPLDIHDLARGLRLDLTRLHDFENALADFRGELELEFAKSVIVGEAANHQSALSDPDLMDFDYKIFQDAVHRLLLRHYTQEVVTTAMPHYRPLDEFRPVRDANSPLREGLLHNVLSHARRDFSELFKYQMQLVAIELFREKVFPEDDFYAGGEVYAAIADRAVMNILEVATLENNVLVLHGKKDIQFTPKNEIVTDMSKTFKALHAGIQRLAEMPEERRLLITLLTRRNKTAAGSFVEIKPDQVKIKTKPTESADEKAIRERNELVIKLFDGIVEVRTKCIDRRIMNTNNLSSADTVDFGMIYEVPSYINNPEFN